LVLNNLNSILIIRLSSLGDILLTTPLLRSLVNHYPGIKIDFLIKEQYSDAIRYNPNIRTIFSYNSSAELIQSLKSNSYNLVVDLQNNARSNKITSKLNASVRKFKKQSIDKFLLVNFKINNLKNAPGIPGRYSHAIPGFEPDNSGNEIFFPPEATCEITGSTKNIGIAPGSRHLTKMWPKEYYVELAKMLISQGYKIFLFGGKSDREICRQITLETGSAVDLSNEDNLLDTALNMKECSLVICNDSGLMHTATAVNVPVCVFFGSTVKEFGFTPHKTKNLILENKLLSCRPCSHIGRESCPLGHFRCMLEITPKVVFERILTLLNS
jgi:ADP-heptose:LPS heptosyltransferase